MASESDDRESTPYRDFDAARGRRISQAMEMAGLSYNCQVCYELGVSESTVSRWRSGSPISLAKLVALAGHLDVSLDWLVLGATNVSVAERACPHAGEFERIFDLLDQPARSLVQTLIRSLAERPVDAAASEPGAMK